uniref:Uncharacterized protein n=1 Tax=viral metagenome TaxID=1070528 RepID=A0A6C0ICJ6_9ZZZZ
MAAVPGILRQWNPGIVPNLQLWIDGSDKSTFTFTNSSNINTIRDKSGKNITLIQNTLSNQPILASNINGRQTVSFPTNVYISTTTTALTSQFNSNNTQSQFGVYKLLDLTTSHIISYMGNINGNAFQQIEYDIGPNKIGLRAKRLDDPNDIFPINQPVSCNVLLLQAYYDTTDFTIKTNIDSNNKPSDSTLQPGGYNINSYNNYYIGKSFNIGTLTQSFNGDIGEIIMFTSNYNFDIRYTSLLEGYLAWKWGLTDLLAGTHPYRNRNPT